MSAHGFDVANLEDVMTEEKKLTSAQIVEEFIRARGPEVVARIEKEARNAWFYAPEVRTETFSGKIGWLFDDVTDEERAGLDRMRGNGNVDWYALIAAFAGTTREKAAS